MIEQTLTMIITPEQQLIDKGQTQLQALELLDQYTLALTEISIDATREISIRQLAGVLLRKYVSKHWTRDIEQFIEPEVPEQVCLRTLLLLRLRHTRSVLGEKSDSSSSSSRTERAEPSAARGSGLRDLGHCRVGLSGVVARALALSDRFVEVDEQVVHSRFDPRAERTGA